MANDLYIKTLRGIMIDKNVPVCSLTRTEIESGIALISDQLKGPLSNAERLWLVEERQGLRKALAQREPAPPHAEE